MHSNQLAAAATTPRRETLSERLDFLDLQTGALFSVIEDLRHVLEPVMVPEAEKLVSGLSSTDVAPAASTITVRVDLASSAVIAAVNKLVGIRNRLEI